MPVFDSIAVIPPALCLNTGARVAECPSRPLPRGARVPQILNALITGDFGEVETVGIYSR